MSFGRWQTTQFLKKMGATSRLKVTSFGGVWDEAEVWDEAGFSVEADEGVEGGVCVEVEAEGGFELC